MLPRCRCYTLALALLASTACSGAAKLVRRSDGAILTGRIERSDARSIYVVERNEQRLVAVSRSEIERISHPGVAAAAVGAGVLAGGTILILAGAAVLDTQEDPCKEPLCFRWDYDAIGGAIVGMGAAIAIGGLVPAIWGLSSYNRSVSAAEPPEGDGAEASALMVAPVVAHTASGNRYGAAVAFRW